MIVLWFSLYSKILHIGLYFVTQLVQEVDVENSLLKDRIVELETEVMALNKVKSSTNFERPEPGE